MNRYSIISIQAPAVTSGFRRGVRTIVALTWDENLVCFGFRSSAVHRRLRLEGTLESNQFRAYFKRPQYIAGNGAGRRCLVRRSEPASSCCEGFKMESI